MTGSAKNILPTRTPKLILKLISQPRAPAYLPTFLYV